MSPCPIAIQAVANALQTPGHAASYVNALGTHPARVAIAAVHSSPPYHTLLPDNVIVANGCSGALELALTALLDDDNDKSILLVPEPGFPLYQVIAESHGARVIHYPLLPDQEWQIDLDELQAILTQYQELVRAVVVNNPSNPTGAVYSLNHLRDIVHICERNRLPIVADEVYGDLVFGDGFGTEETNNNRRPVFVPLARVAARLGRNVPVITASGLGKQYLLPGWRVGWICFQDK